MQYSKTLVIFHLGKQPALVICLALVVWASFHFKTVWRLLSFCYHPLWRSLYTLTGDFDWLQWRYLSWLDVISRGAVQWVDGSDLQSLRVSVGNATPSRKRNRTWLTLFPPCFFVAEKAPLGQLVIVKCLLKPFECIATYYFWKFD